MGLQFYRQDGAVGLRIKLTIQAEATAMGSTSGRNKMNDFFFNLRPSVGYGNIKILQRALNGQINGCDFSFLVASTDLYLNCHVSNENR